MTRRTSPSPFPKVLFGALLAFLGLALGACQQAGAPGTWAPVQSGSGSWYDDGADGSLRARGEELFDSTLADLDPSEELWVVERDRSMDGLAISGDPLEERLDDGTRLDAIRLGDVPGGGGLLTREGGRTVVVPLEHTRVRARLQGVVAGVRVEQRFTNPYDRPIEATYVFPLHQDAAVTEFVMTLGERRIRGVVREKEEARELYEAARAQGITAALLTQERPNLFVQKVANILPGQRIEVSLDCFHGVALDDGWFEWVFPMVVGPRYNPPGQRDGVGAVALGARGSSGQPTEVPYLRPDQRSGHDVSLEVHLDAGTALAAVSCPTHDVELRETGVGRVRAHLAAHDRIPNRDLVLRWRVAAPQTTLALLEQQDHALLTIHPPEDLASLRREPLELVCVVDTSGSMRGEPLDLCRGALHAALEELQPSDTFELIRFSNGSTRLARGPVPADARNLREGHRWIEGLDANGGTAMLKGVRAALRHRADRERRRVVLFLTDGFIGNDDEILAAVANRADRARVFTLAIGSSPNRYLLERMAAEGDGVASWIGLGADAGAITRSQLTRLSHPALEDLEIQWGARTAQVVYPRELPDLFHGRPLHVIAKLAPQRPGEGIWGGPVVVRGRVDGAWREVAVAWPAGDEASGRLAAVSHVVEHADGHLDPGPDGVDVAIDGALPKVWARARIAQLSSDALRLEGSERQRVLEEARDTALTYGLLSQWTAFLAVDTHGPRADGPPTAVDVPVRVPAGVEYETTVGSLGGEER